MSLSTNYLSTVGLRYLVGAAPSLDNISSADVEKYSRAGNPDKCDWIPIKADGKAGEPSVLFFNAVANQRQIEFIDSALHVLWEKYWGKPESANKAIRRATKVWLWQLPGLKDLRPPLDRGSMRRSMWDAMKAKGFRGYDQGRHFDTWLDLMKLAQVMKASDAGGRGQPGKELFEWLKKESPPVWELEQRVKKGSEELGKSVPAYKNFYDDVMAHMAAKKQNPHMRYYSESDKERAVKANYRGGLTTFRRGWTDWRCPWTETLIYNPFNSPAFKKKMPGVTPEQAFKIYSKAQQVLTRDPATGDESKDVQYFNYREFLNPSAMKDFSEQPYGFERLLIFINEALTLLQEEGDSTGNRGIYLWKLPGFEKVQLEGLRGWDKLLKSNADASIVEKEYGTHQSLKDPRRAPVVLTNQQKLGVYLKPVPKPPYVTRSEVNAAMGPVSPETQEVIKDWWPTQVNAWANAIGETYKEHMIPASRWEKTLNEADPKFAARVYKSLYWKKPTEQVLGKAATTISAEAAANQAHRKRAQENRAEEWKDRPATEKWSDFATNLMQGDAEHAFNVNLPNFLPDFGPYKDAVLYGAGGLLVGWLFGGTLVGLAGGAAGAYIGYTQAKIF